MKTIAKTGILTTTLGALATLTIVGTALAPSSILADTADAAISYTKSNDGNGLSVKKQILKFDVAEDATRFVFAEPQLSNGLPACGNEFVTQGNDIEWMMYGWSVLHCES